MKDLKIYYEVEGTIATANDEFEIEIKKLAEKFGLRFVRDHFEEANRIRMIYFRKE